MAFNKPIVSTCADNGSGRCATHENGRHKLDGNSLCKVGRRLLRESAICPICHKQFAQKTGMVLADQRKENTIFSSLNVVIDQIGTEAVCPECAEFYIDDLGTNVFVTHEALRTQVKKFVESFLAGGSVMHRHERLGNQMRNWCDTCGSLVVIEDEESMGGVIRGNSVICLCTRCDSVAHQAMPDLPAVTFFDGLEQVSTFRRPLPKPAPTPARRPAKPAKTIVRKPATPTDELDEIEQIVNDEEQAPAPEAEQPARKPAKKLVFASVHDVYQAIVDGEHVNFGRKDEATGKTRCVVHANAPELCKCPGGLSDWDRMPAIVRGEQAFGFGAECGAQLATHGVKLETTLKAAILQINGQEDFNKSPRPRTNFAPKVQMEFVNPNPTRAPKKRKVGVSASQRIREEGRKAFDAKLADLDAKISTKRAALIKIGKEIDDLRDAAGDDPELLELAREELEKLTVKSDDLLRQIQDINAEREAVSKAGPRAFRQKPTRHAQASQPAEGGKKNKKGKEKRGSKAA